MEFKEIGKYVIIALITIGLIGLVSIFYLQAETPDETFGFGNSDTVIEASEDFGRLNAPRIILLIWETFWLTAIAIGFFLVASRSKGMRSSEEEHTIEKFEPKLFKYVVIILILGAFMTLVVPALIGPGLPHYRTNADATDITVIAEQYLFTINGEGCSPSVSCITLNAGEAYAFLLESTDTTHGFAVYDEDNTLIIQAQIVPGYTTRLVHTFDAGEYTIRCSEYCSAGHHLMKTMFTVV